MFKIGIDVGGTFTDIVVQDAKGKLVQGKVPSVPGNESEAVMGALRLMADQFGVDLPRFLADEFPGLAVFASSEVLPRVREFERFSTTIVNASMSPLLRSYLKRLMQR